MHLRLDRTTPPREPHPNSSLHPCRRPFDDSAPAGPSGEAHAQAPALHQAHARWLEVMCRLCLSAEPGMPPPPARVRELSDGGFVSIQTLLDTCAIFAVGSMPRCRALAEALWATAPLARAPLPPHFTSRAFMHARSVCYTSALLSCHGRCRWCKRCAILQGRQAVRRR